MCFSHVNINIVIFSAFIIFACSNEKDTNSVKTFNEKFFNEVNPPSLNKEDVISFLKEKNFSRSLQPLDYDDSCFEGLQLQENKDNIYSLSFEKDLLQCMSRVDKEGIQTASYTANFDFRVIKNNGEFINLQNHAPPSPGSTKEDHTYESRLAVITVIIAEDGSRHESYRYKSGPDDDFCEDTILSGWLTIKDCTIYEYKITFDAEGGVSHESIFSSQKKNLKQQLHAIYPENGANEKISYGNWNGTITYHDTSYTIKISDGSESIEISIDKI